MLILNIYILIFQSKVDIEHSEMLFYQNMLLREQGKIDESLQHLDTYENKFTDKLQVQEIKGTYC